MASSNFPVAVIGMAVRLPGAQTCEEFWQLLINGRDTVSEFPPGRAADINHVLTPFIKQLVNQDKPFFTGSFFRSVDEFDANVFQINPREALFIEPEQRIFLETVWELLEDAGYASSIKSSKTGIYVGNTVNKYKYILTENHPSISHGNHSPFISSRVSYTHDLKGPAMMVATGCSSSLLAVHLACQGLQSGDCEMAIAGGITLDLLPISTNTDIWNQLGITGPNARCRAFDASARGIAKGEGCGVVLVKPLHKALSDSDHIYGVLQATTANQDGHSNGITAPHPGAQANMLYQAWKLADISPDKLEYFEAHGTGTELGDPIEISGITYAYEMFGLTFHGESAKKVPIGSVKANIGHLADGGAGIVALIKVLLCMHSSKIPPAINFSKPNPHINWKTSPVYVNTSLLDWKPHNDQTPRFASVSAFGLLGTNVHAVVREHVATPEPTLKHPSVDKGAQNKPQPLALAAYSRKSLVLFVTKLAQYFKRSGNRSYCMLKNVCYTMNTGRELTRFQYRAVVYANTWQGMMHTLEQLHTALTGDLINKHVTKTDSVTGYTTSDDGTTLCGSFSEILAAFLQGKTVCFKGIYSHMEKDEVKRVPLIPTYAFERVRYWPKVGKPINKSLLQLEHNPQENGIVESDSTGDKSSFAVLADVVIQTALNEALGTTYEWNEVADKNLFELGVDSLICTQVCMKLQDEMSCSFSMSEFHNPTFSGLKSLVIEKVTSASHSKSIKRNREDQTTGPTYASRALKEALNEALGKNYNWQKLEHENLFTLGVDSLIYTSVCMKLKESLGLDVPFTMDEFHKNPSYSRLCDVIEVKLNLSTSVTKSSAKSPTETAMEHFPLSFSQRRLWVMQQIATNPCAYTATNCLKITGDFHPAAFIISTNNVLSRHSAFYTVIIDSADEPVQMNNWKLQVCVKESNVQSEDTVMKLYDEDYRTPFDLKEGPLVRCHLYHLPNGTYYFTMVIHHIIFDGWSHFVFYNELWDTYNKVSAGKKVANFRHEPLYVEFAKEEQLDVVSSSPAISNDLIYWKKKLCEPLPLSTLPGDKRRPPIFTHNGRRITRFINHEVIEFLQRFSGGQYTMFMTLLSAVYVLMYHYTSDNDIIIGTPVAGRNNLKAKHVIGRFVNTLALRVQLKGDMSFNQVLEVVCKTCLEAFDHQHTPFDHLINKLNLSRDTSITPVFSVNVCYHNTEMRAEHTSIPSELTVERRLLHDDSAKWDLYFDFLHETEGMRFTLEYYYDVFSDLYAECIVENFLTLLSTVSQQASLAISELNVIPQLCHEQKHNNASVIHGITRNLGDQTLSVLLLNSLQLHGEMSSVVKINGQSIKYYELLAQAERLAVFLRETCELPKQSRVGILLGNSVEALESIIACVICGLVYVPLDSNSPKPRLELICTEAELKAIIFSVPNVVVANCLQWACPSVNIILCVDAVNFEELQEDIFNTPLMDTELWNAVAYKAEDDIEGGGWKSSYTGKHMTSEEMNEYAENVFKRLKEFINPTSKVLEIGCASGLTTQKLCQNVYHYVATDISQSMVDRLEKKLLNQGVRNVEVICVSADQVGYMFQDQKFDVIIMNSVVHCFPGHNYLRKVMSACEKLLDIDGVIFMGDIMDLELKDDLVASLKLFKEAHPEHRVKTEWHSELFLSRNFIQHLCDSSTTLKDVSCFRKFYTIPNELTEYRFDAVFTKSNCSRKQVHMGKRETKTCAISDVEYAVNTKYENTSDIHETVSGWAYDVEPRDKAYILYTSGTTGTPRGVIIGHESLLNYVTWAIAAYRFDTTTSMPLFSPLTFDFTLTSIFPPLLSGSTIYIFRCFQESYLAMASCKEITTVKFSPIQLDTILSACDNPLSASTFIVGGEELTPTLLTKLKKNKMDENFVIWNEYGPTEATVGCVVRCFSSEELPLDQCELVPIGQPIDNVTIAVVGDNFKPVPIGGKGALTIGGKCLCLDFAGKGAAKAAKRSKSFKAACWGRPGEQMLHTDDIVEVMPMTCQLAYFGRHKECNTTKVNGVRVDLMEIQYAIESNQLVDSAWVCSFELENHTYLGAAVKLKPLTQRESCQSGKTWKQILISSLTQSLPTSWIPKVFTAVSNPPTNANGKKDTPFLQRIFIDQMQTLSEQYSANVQDTSSLQSTLLFKLQRIWQSILPIQHLPSLEEDFFFDLSGDSLQAIHLVRKMRDEGYEISVTDIFQNPSIGKLIPILQENSYDITQAHLVATVPENIKFKPTPILEDYFTRLPSLKHPDHFALPALLRFHGKLEVKVLRKALRSVMMKHGSLHSKFDTSEGSVTQHIVPLHPDEPEVVEVSIIRKHDHIANEPAFIHLCQQLEESHSLSEGILLNAGIINLIEQQATDEFRKSQIYVLLVVHHVGIDIVSWQQVLQDLASALRHLSQEEKSEVILQKCRLPFSAYCETLHTEASSGLFAAEVTYWADIERQCTESGTLVNSSMPGQFKSAKWMNKSFDFSFLRSTSTKLGCSSEHVILTAFGRSMSLIHGQDKTAICLESHGRQLPSVDSTDTVGWCTSKFPFVLDTPLMEDIVPQVKMIREAIDKIPHHGLGFGLLKSAGKVSVSYPKIMFVFQGSLDASTKQMFDGGNFKFDHIPWIEIMLNELKLGRFHRHPEEILEFDLEMIAWIHGGELKFGCLFDKEVINESTVQEILEHTDMNIKALTKWAHNEAKTINIKVIPSFNITSDCVQTIEDALHHHGITVEEMNVHPPEQAIQSLYKADEEAADIIVIVTSHETDSQAKEFTEAYNQNRDSWKSKIAIISVPTVRNSAKLPVEDLKDNVVEVPESIVSGFYDRSLDLQFNLPFTQDGYTHLGLTIARTIRATLCSPMYKVIAVDTDYTLWNGECADGTVSITPVNIVLHEFLIKMKRQGMLLVILSKNSKQDVENVFESQQKDMVLQQDDFVAVTANWEQKSANIRHVAQMLSLSLNTFVFIDDSVIECIDMIKSCPEVLTLQFPSTIEHVTELLDNLWILDNFNITSESAKRTEMYRSEFVRQEGVKSLENIDSTSRNTKLVELLYGWNMKITICKTTITLLKQSEKLCARVTGLLLRTNQFKLNNVNTKLDAFEDDDFCWLVSLKDCYGSCGIVSVIILSSGYTLVHQWVLSCRALGRDVERRILYEIHKESRRIQKSMPLHLAVNQIGHNTPASKFLKSFGFTTDVSGTDLLHIVLKEICLDSDEDLHKVDSTTDLIAFEEEVYSIPEEHIKGAGSSMQHTSNLENISQWIKKEWFPLQKQQAVHHSLFPIIPECKYFTKNFVRLAETGREYDLRSVWMEVLESNTEPENSDNFLTCGGTSLCAVFLVSKLRKTSKIDINVMDLLQNPQYNQFRNIVLRANNINDDEAQELQQNKGKSLPLSAAQQRMLMLQLAAPHSTAYTETIACYTRKSANAVEIFQDLVKQHPILTSRIEMDNESNMYMLTVNEEMTFDLEPEMVDIEAAQDYLTKSIPAMEILSAPLVKFRHLNTGELAILVVHMHHVITDEVTLTNVLHDLQKLISGAALKPQFSKLTSASFIDSEKHYLNSSQYAADNRFWREKFTTLPPSANLAIHTESTSMWKDTEVYEARQTSMCIPVETVEEITKYCKMLGVTEFQYYLACTSLVLQRYLGVYEITLAIPVTTRTDIYQHTDGLFVNTVLFKIVVDPNISLKAHVKAVANSWLETLCHSQYPFDHVVKQMWIDHEKSASSFCNVMFNYASRNKLQNVLRVSAKHAKMPLTLDIIHTNNHTSELFVEWAADLIDDGIAKRLADGVLRMCCKALEETDNMLCSIEALSPSEHELLQSFNPHLPVSHTKECLPIHKHFEENAAMNPDTVAVLCGGSSLLYSQLKEMATQIAYGLCQRIELTILKRKPILIVMKKDEYAIASILGIWKAGGHFQPVALTTQERLKHILARCAPAAILSNIPTDTLPGLDDEGGSFPILNVAELISYSSGSETMNVQTTNDDLAYIIMTSGSTGRPKQCKITHKSLATIASAWRERYKMNEFKVNVLQWAPLSFDVFVGDVVRSLICAPGQLTICPDEMQLDVSHILNLIKEHNVTLAEVTPQFGLQLVNSANSEDLGSLKLFILGSDVLQCHLYNRIRAFLKQDQRVINSYGMTEATIDSSFFEGSSLPNTRSGTVPIGKPLPGVNLHVLDAKTLQPCPVGTIGELYITGNVLASGDVEVIQLKHLHSLGLKTGDAACWLPSGDVELLGRLDSMVKLRGFRISTTEIENKIVECVSSVKEACVVPLKNDEDSTGIEFLCGFLVLSENANEHTVDRQAVCNQLKGELPYYMLPDVVCTIDKIPLTANGKVNHKALPKVSHLLNTQVQQASTNFRCTSPTRSVLAELFAEALGIQDASHIHHERTFMEQGGHSLVLMRLSSLIKQKSTFDVGIAELFSYPSISFLADYIDGENSEKLQPIIEEVQVKDESIAITGLGLRLPGGIMSLPQLWEVLEEGNDLVREFPRSRASDVLDCLPSYHALDLSETDTFQGAFLEQIDQFDATFFNIAPGEAKFMSPEQRLFLQVATEALAEGKLLSKVRGTKVGVFVGSSEVGYSKLNHPDEAVCVSGLLPGMIATRVAYQWDLKGPTMLVDTACSSALVALKQACDSIKRNECEGALVGGVSLVLYPARRGIFGRKSSLSPDFHCRAFDKDTSGTAVGEGVMCLYVEPLRRALDEKKPVYGIIKSIASNNVGHGNGIGAPTSSSQQKVIQAALSTAQVKPSDITFVESHGTGTKLGDRIELAALSAVFNEAQSVNKLPIGSVKSMFGLLDCASGLLGVFKVIVSLLTKQIPPTVHFKEPHPELAKSSLWVPKETISWKVRKSCIRIAGVSSFGLTGTNCHAIIAEPSAGLNVTQDQVKGTGLYPLLFSGRNMEQIKKQMSVYKSHIKQTVLKMKFNTLLSLCLTVAQRLKELTETKVGHTKWRMVIIAADSTHMLKKMDIVTSMEDADAVIRLSTLRNDIFVCCPEHQEKKATSPAICSYIVEGNVDLEGLFGGNNCHIKAALGVTLAMYNESRHWVESTPAGTHSEGLLDLIQRKLVETREIVRSLPLAPPQDLKETQGSFCAAIIIKLLLRTDMAEYIQKSREITFTKAFSLSGILTKYKKLFFVMIRELFENGLIQATGWDESIHCLDSFRFNCQNVLNTDPEVIANTAIKRYPLWADCFRFPLYCSVHLHEVLQGTVSPLSVIYPQGDLNFMYQFDKLGDLLGDVYYNMYMQVIATYARQLSSQEKVVRVLEIGAGVGHVTRQLLPKLKGIPNIEYWFTDLGNAFVEHAKTLFANYLYMMKFATFDITKSPLKQGLLGEFDIVISYNVIHATQSIMDSVVNLRSCLGDAGTLFIIESAKNETWATLAWGILDGWWFFKDYDLRPAEPMMEPEKWERVLAKSGFSSVLTCPVDEHERGHVEKYLFVCSARNLSKTVSSVQPEPGWWETDPHRFDPIKKLDELNDEDSSTGMKEAPVDRKAIHEELKSIWSELLGVHNIQPDDDFNSLGGESLHAIQMMKLVRKKIGYQLEIADTFCYPTMGALADFIADGMERLKKADSIGSNIQTDRSITFCASAVDKSDFSYYGATRSSEISLSEGGDKSASSANEHEGLLLMFPGQGAQKLGMCISMKDSPEAMAVFKQAEQVLGYNVLDICSDDSILEGKLKSTEFVQVSLFLGCIAKLEQLRAERQELINKVTHVAGLSAGEFAALVVAGVVDFVDALKLVQECGKAMEDDARSMPSGMVSVFGPSCEKLEEYLARNFTNMKISTYLADNQHTVAGTSEECYALVKALSQQYKEQMNVIDARNLRVAGAFHSSYMKQAAKRVGPIIESTKFSRPSIPLIMNVSGQVVEDPKEIQEQLHEQLVAPVKWKQTILTAYESGVRRFIEIAPSRVLSPIVKKRISQCKDCKVEHVVV